jgi:hypothetical protein
MEGTGQHPFVCVVCDRSYKNKRALRMHEKQLHTCHLETAVSADNRVAVSTNDGTTDITPVLQMPDDLDVNVGVVQSTSVVKADHMIELQLLDYQPSGRTDHVEICVSIAEANNMLAVTVNGDGSCQYHAVIEGLRSISYIEPFTVNSLRQRVYSEILSDWSKYIEFLPSRQMNLDLYVEGILENQWGDELTLTAMCATLNIRAVVYEFTVNSQFIHHVGSSDSRYCIYLILDSRNEGVAHYSAMVNRMQTAVLPTQVCQGSLSFDKHPARMQYCAQCSTTFKNKMAVAMHCIRVHSKLLDGLSTAEISFGSDNSSVTESVLDVPYDERRESEPAVGSQYSSLVNVINWIRQNDNECEICHKMYKSKNGLLQHIRRSHKVNGKSSDLNKYAKCGLLNVSSDEIKQARNHIEQLLVDVVGHERNEDANEEWDSSSDRTKLSSCCDSEYSIDSVASDGSSVRRSQRLVNKQRKLVAVESFKIPDKPSESKRRCAACGIYFKDLANHVKCPRTLLSTAVTKVENVDDIKIAAVMPSAHAIIDDSLINSASYNVCDTRVLVADRRQSARLKAKKRTYDEMTR